MTLSEVETGLTYRIEIQKGWPADGRRRAQKPKYVLLTVATARASWAGDEPRHTVTGTTEDGRWLSLSFEPDHPVELVQDDDCVCGEPHDETSALWLRPDARTEQVFAHEDCAKTRGYTELA